MNSSWKYLRQPVEIKNRRQLDALRTPSEALVEIGPQLLLAHVLLVQLVYRAQIKPINHKTYFTVKQKAYSCGECKSRDTPTPRQPNVLKNSRPDHGRFR